MPFITFIYRVGKNENIYYGKYVSDYVSDDNEGLDEEIKPFILEGVNKYRKQRNFPLLKKNKLMVGIMSFSRDEYVPTYSSEAEIDCFHFYCICINRNLYRREKEFCVNGRKI